MNPNSKNQLWSCWIFTVTPGLHRSLTRQGPSFAMVQANCARFGRKAFGSAGQMHIERKLHERRVVYVVQVRVEGPPAHDPEYVAFMQRSWERFFVEGFGYNTTVSLEVRVEAGDVQDGRPPAQLIILPPLGVH
jgi:hypothetical protein